MVAATVASCVDLGDFGLDTEPLDASGVVLSRIDDLPIFGASVWLRSAEGSQLRTRWNSGDTVRTAADGRFEIEESVQDSVCSSGGVEIVVTAVGFEATTQTLPLCPGRNPQRTVRMDPGVARPATATVWGFVMTEYRKKGQRVGL